VSVLHAANFTSLTNIRSDYSADQVAALPPPLVKIRELEQENARLLAENEEMRRIIAENPQTRGRALPDFGRRTTAHNGRDCDERDYKKRKVEDSLYMVSRARKVLNNSDPFRLH
jgi:hypothetical protein